MADKCLASRTPSTAGPSERPGFEDDIALTREHLADVHALHDGLRDSLLSFECYINTELMQMERRTPRYSPYRYPEREKLQRRLGDLAAERRRLAVTEQEQVHRLQRQLLELLGKETRRVEV